MLKIYFFLVIVNKILLIDGLINYCDKSLCKNASVTHINCDNNGKFGSSCSANARLITLTRLDMKKIVRAHNEKRNDIAAGKIPRYETAERMTKMKWSPELAKMAELNVKRCKYEHDYCHSTQHYLYSGQNMYTSFASNGILSANPKEYFYFAIDKWFSEHKNCDMSYINKFRNERIDSIGDFTLLVSDRNRAVGCAAVLFTEHKKKKVIVTCNYAFTNIVNKSVYKVGKTGSRCIYGTDSKYTALCNAKEKHNINDINSLI